MSNGFMFYNNLDDTAQPMIIHVDQASISLLMNQIAWTIIQSCDEYYLNGRKFNVDMNQFIHVAEHGYYNHFIALVKFLFSFVRDNRNNNWVKSLVNQNMIADALKYFKKIKDEERAKEIEEFGENFGSLLAFTQWDPCEFNEEWGKD